MVSMNCIAQTANALLTQGKCIMDSDVGSTGTVE